MYFCINPRALDKNYIEIYVCPRNLGKSELLLKTYRWISAKFGKQFDRKIREEKR